VNNGLTNTDIYAFAVTTTGVIFAGTAGEGVFRSEDNGDTWTAVNTGLTDTDVRSLLLDPSGYLFAGTIGGTVFRSVESVD